MKSWKTTLAGWIVGGSMILAQIGAAIPSWEITLMAIGVIAGGTAARDNSVSSERAGAK